MKHGPIALIDDMMPVVFVAPRDAVYQKVVSNVEEVKARGGRVIAIVTEGDTGVARLADHKIEIPETLDLLTPVLSCCRCSCWRITSPCGGAAMSTSRGTWRSP